MQPMPVMRTRSRIGPVTVPWGVLMVNLPRRSVARDVVFVLALVQVLVAAPGSRAASQGRTPSTASSDRFTEIYNRSVLKQRSIRSIRARFTETTVSSLLVKPLVAHGVIIAAPPARVVMTYADPEPKTLTMDDKTLVIAWPGRREREQINIVDMQKRIDQYFTNASIGQLRSMFQITARPDPSVPHTDQIEMRPTRKQIQRGLERLELWVDRESDLLTRMRMTFPGGDQKTIVLEDITVNVPVTDEMFRGDVIALSTSPGDAPRGTPPAASSAACEGASWSGAAGRAGEPAAPIGARTYGHSN